MTARTFASWVEPVAAETAKARREVAEVARALPDGAWGKPAPMEGWTYKDLLAHLAGLTDKNLLRVLRAVVARERVDPAVMEDEDGKNARDVESRRGRSVAELIAEYEADSEEIDDLLSRLTQEDKDLRQKNIPMSLGEGLSANPGGHDREHLADLRTALEGGA